jgi:hypothetical protein
MRNVRKSGELPSSSTIVRETCQKLGYIHGAIDPTAVIAGFNELLRALWEETLVTLEEHEERAYARGIPAGLIDLYSDEFSRAKKVAQEQGFQDAILQLFGTWYPALRQSFLSISQSRKTRGGKDFELAIEGLFKLADIPFHKQEARFHTDLILPDLPTHVRNRNISAVVSAKRTLRERWQEVAEELFNLRSPNVFLFTADEAITSTHVERICGQYNIYLVVWDTEKARKFSTEPLVLGYTEWATERLSILRQHWGRSTSQGRLL